MKASKASAIPSVGKVVQEQYVKDLINEHGRELVTDIVRREIAVIRHQVLAKKKANNLQKKLVEKINEIKNGTLKRVINAAGVILHTNLGRAPIGRETLAKIVEEVSSYSNLEFNLSNGERGSRYTHITDVFSSLCSAEKSLVVNNNAAGVLVALSALARGSEVIVSRGELIEIGGSFRMPDIMASAGCKLVEVGTTNKTKISDYAKAITENTAAIMKVHHSNFRISGFTQETHVGELSKLCNEHRLPLIYDLGSGIPCPNPELPFQSEPDVKTSLEQGADVVLFSCDKLMAGAQGGVIAGKEEYIAKVSKDPLLRAMRISKLDLAVLAHVARSFFKIEDLRRIPVYKLLLRSPEERLAIAEELASVLKANKVNCNIEQSAGQMGGGTLPQLELHSYALELDLPGESGSQRAAMAERFHRKLMKRCLPVVGYLKAGSLFFDVLTIFDDEKEVFCQAIIETAGELKA